MRCQNGNVALAIHSIRLLVSLTVFAICAFVQTLQAEGVKLSLSAALSPPQTTADQTGYIDLIAKEAFERANVGLAYQSTTVRRGMFGTATGEFDGFIAAPIMPAPQLKPLVRVLEPIFASIAGGVFLRDGIEINTLSDFSKYRVGYPKACKRAAMLLRDVPDKYAAHSPALLMEMLAQNRIDVAFTFFSQARHIATERKITGLKFSKYMNYSRLYIHLNPKHAEIAPELARAIRSMKVDGTYFKILGRANTGTKQDVSE